MVQAVSGKIEADILNKNFSELDSKVETVSGGPGDTLNSLVELNSKYPSGADFPVVVLESDGKIGYLYTWNPDNKTWKKGALYQEMGIPDNGIDTGKVTNLNKTGYYIASDGKPVNLNTEKKVLEVPSGQFKFGNFPVGVSKHDVDVSAIMTGYQEFTFYFDRATNRFVLANNEIISTLSQNVILMGVCNIGTRIANVNFSLVINNQPLANRQYNGLSFMLAANSHPIEYDFKNDRVILPGDLALSIGSAVLQPAEINEGKQQLMPMLSVEQQLVTLDLDTKKSRLLDYNDSRNDIKSNEIIVGYFNKATKKVTCSYWHTIDGQSPLNETPYYGSAPFMFTMDDDIDYDFVNNKIVIPKTTSLHLKDRYFPSASFTKNAVVEVPMIVGRDGGALTWNILTREFKVKLGEDFPLKSTDIILSIFSKSYKKAVMSGLYKVNGSYPNKTEKPENDDELPAYVKKGITDLVDVVSLINNKNKLSFGFITDTHGYRKHIQALAKFAEYGQMDYVVHGGDINSAERPISEVRNIYNQSQAYFRKIKEPLFVIRGNHDSDGTGSSDIGTMTNAEFTNRLITSQTQNGNAIFPSEPDAGYYYHDDEARKIRMVFSNSSIATSANLPRWGFDKEQLKWIAEKALNFSSKADGSEWQLLFFSHHNPRQKFSTTRAALNGEALLSILKAFKDGEAYSNSELEIDVTYDKSHTIIAYVFGHTHCDALSYETDLGFHLISTASSLPDYYETPGGEVGVNKSWKRPMETLDEDCWDMFVIDTKNRNVKIKRFGAGEDREFSYGI